MDNLDRAREILARLSDDQKQVLVHGRALSVANESRFSNTARTVRAGMGLLSMRLFSATGDGCVERTPMGELVVFLEEQERAGA